MYKRQRCLRAAEAFGDVLSSIVDLQDALLRQLRAEVLRNATFLRDIERCVSEIDCLLAYADVARRFDMRRPELVDDDSLRIERARHPLYQSFMDHEFIPNDIEFAADGGRVKIITGANGSGKTAVIQTVGVVFLAHVGSFVPASSARIGLTDRVFTSIVGFKDDPERKAKVPESGFTYALHAVSRMIHNATRRSLCLIDEFGTSTRAEDGCALLTAIVEYIASRECVPKMMVTTHFREMCDIIGDASPMIEYLRTAVVVNANDRADASLWREDVTMLFRLEPGVADSSFALNMCRLIGMPKDFIDRFTHLCERDAAARRGEVLPVLDPYGDPAQEEKFLVYKSIVDRFDATAANPTEENLDAFIAFFDALDVDDYLVPRACYEADARAGRTFPVEEARTLDRRANAETRGDA